MASQRRQLIAGNWKMNTGLDDAVSLAHAIVNGATGSGELAVFPPFPWLVPVKSVVDGSGVSLGAQDCWSKPNGAFTGAVSAQMLSGLCAYVIVGHSERRQWFGDSDEIVRDKLDAVLAANMTPILCVGERLETRQSGDAERLVRAQIVAALGDRTATQIMRCVVAYEPIWAIGTGVAASADDAESMSAVIREEVDSLAPGAGQSVRILYGGSVTPANAAETLSKANVDGALVGGASLKADSFLAIAAAAN